MEIICFTEAELPACINHVFAIKSNLWRNVTKI